MKNAFSVPFPAAEPAAAFLSFLLGLARVVGTSANLRFWGAVCGIGGVCRCCSSSFSWEPDFGMPGDLAFEDVVRGGPDSQDALGRSRVPAQSGGTAPVAFDSVDEIADACRGDVDGDPDAESETPMVVVTFAPLAKNVDNNICFPENSSQRRAASRGRAATPLSSGGGITSRRESFTPASVVISS